MVVPFGNPTDKCASLSSVRKNTPVYRKDISVARIFQRGGHTLSNRGYSRFRNLNIVGCLSKKRLTKGGLGHPRTPLATPLRKEYRMPRSFSVKLLSFGQLTLCRTLLKISSTILQVSRQLKSFVRHFDSPWQSMSMSLCPCPCLYV